MNKKPIKKNCSFCSELFLPTKEFRVYCSQDCQKKGRPRYEYFKKNREKLNNKKAEYAKNGGTPKVCKQCSKTFFGAWSAPKYCNRKCYFEHEKISRKGKGNPAYRNGTRSNGKTVTAKHLDTTRKYGKEFVDKHGYKYCEYCKINQSLRFETHHIIFASEKPRHEFLHDKRNLILLCIQCHNDFHSGKTHEKRLSIVKDRNLVELFGKSIL